MFGGLPLDVVVFATSQVCKSSNAFIRGLIRITIEYRCPVISTRSINWPSTVRVADSCSVTLWLGDVFQNTAHLYEPAWCGCVQRIASCWPGIIPLTSTPGKPLRTVSPRLIKVRLLVPMAVWYQDMTAWELLGSQVSVVSLPTTTAALRGPWRIVHMTAKQECTAFTSAYTCKCNARLLNVSSLQHRSASYRFRIIIGQVDFCELKTSILECSTAQNN